MITSNQLGLAGAVGALIALDRLFGLWWALLVFSALLMIMAWVAHRWEQDTVPDEPMTEERVRQMLTDYQATVAR